MCKKNAKISYSPTVSIYKLSAVFNLLKDFLFLLPFLRDLTDVPSISLIYHEHRFDNIYCLDRSL